VNFYLKYVCVFLNYRGARHGIKMNGKLARIQEQERILAEQLSTKLNQPNDINVKNNINEFQDNKEGKRKKKDSNCYEDLKIDLNDVSIETEDKQIKKKKKKKKKQSKDE
jgi:hypothetical protein